jgi:beta-glucosidase
VQEAKPVVKRPTKELKAFEKVYLAPGQQQQIRMVLPAEAFEYFSEEHKKFVHQPGQYWILAGNASDKISTKASIQL